MPPVPSTPPPIVPAVLGRAAALGIWAIGQGWWGQWAKSEVWPCHSHFLNSWGLGKSKVTICFRHTDPEI